MCLGRRTDQKALAAALKRRRLQQVLKIWFKFKTILHAFACVRRNCGCHTYFTSLTVSAFRSGARASMRWQLCFACNVKHAFHTMLPAGLTHCQLAKMCCRIPDEFD